MVCREFRRKVLGGQEEPDTLCGWDGLPLGAFGPLTCDGEWASHLRPKTTYAKPQASRARSSWCERQAVLRRVTHPLPRSSEAATTSCLVTDVPHPQCLASCLAVQAPDFPGAGSRMPSGPSPPPFRSPVFGRLPGCGLGEPGREEGMSGCCSTGGGPGCVIQQPPLDAQECGWHEEPAGH